MAQTAKHNVVALGDHPRAKARLTPRESADVLADCRQLALDRMTRALAGMLDRVEDDLFELAEKAIDREAQNAYLDARAKAREKRPVIETQFRDRFVEFFDRKVRGESAAPGPDPTAGELALVAPEELEESIAMQEMSRKLGAACEGELFALSQRIGFLLERPGLQDEANPLSPSTVFAALRNACEQIDAGFKVKLALLRQLESHAEAELQGIYRDLNAHLVQRQILPEVRVSVRKPQTPPRPKAEGAPDAAKPADVFATFAQLLGAAMPSLGAAMPSSGAVPSTGAAAPNAPAAAVPASFLSELTRMHRDGAAGAAQDGTAAVNVLKGIRAAPQSASLGALDAMTIDLVSMLFDYIFEDRHIPAGVKAWLARLQIPTLKVALLDRNFFSSKAHPARRLIDRLAECALGVDEANGADSGCLAMVEGVVGRILAEFETDLALFETELARVEAFIEERKRAEAELVERSARLVEAREREEIARACAEEEVGRRIDSNPWVPAAVRAMLEDVWVRALAAVRLVEGERSPAWQSLVATMDELIWSVEPKSDAEDRKRLVAILPGMLKNVVEGLRRGSLDDAARDAFLGALVDCHAAAVKSGLRGMAALPEVPIPARAAAPAIERAVVPGDDVRVEEIRLRAQRGAVRNVFTRTGIWTNLQRGTWVEFAGMAGSKRARLTWISPNKGVYLFTNPLSGQAAVSISPEALAEQMRLGEARMLDDAPLVDRAVDSMLATLRDGAAAAQG